MSDTRALPGYLQPQIDTQRPPRDERDPPGVYDCAHCAERFARRSHRDLHVGRAHGSAMSPDEATAYEAALADEVETLRRLRRHVTAGFAAFPVLLAFFATWILLLATDSNPGMALMLLPGYAAFGIVVYGIVFSWLGLKAQREDGTGTSEEKE